jgi:C_GCAxxG_C_C family probable redox protein
MSDHATAKAAQAQANFDQGYNCAQSVFMVFAEDLGVTADQSKLIAAVFGAGMGRLQETCGALTGAFMALGLAKGFTDPADQATRDRLLAETKALAAGFKAEFGSLSCRDLLGCDLNTPEGQAIHKETNQRALICGRCVRFTASHLAGILAKT